MVNLTRTRSRENQLLWTIVTELKDNTLSEQVCSINDLFCSCKSPEMTRKPCWHKLRAGIDLDLKCHMIFGEYYTTDYWKYQYRDVPDIKPISNDDWRYKAEGDAIMPFAAKNMKGRPKKHKRMKGCQEIYFDVAKKKGKVMGSITSSDNITTITNKGM